MADISKIKVATGTYDLKDNRFKIYETVMDMQNDSKLKLDDVVILKSYHGDNLKSTHKRVIESYDDGSGVAVGSYFANIVHDGYVKLSQLGCVNDNATTDSTAMIQKALNYASNKVTLVVDGLYLVTSTIILPSNLKMVGAWAQGGHNVYRTQKMNNECGFFCKNIDGWVFDTCLMGVYGLIQDAVTVFNEPYIHHAKQNIHIEDVVFVSDENYVCGGALNINGCLGVNLKNIKTYNFVIGCNISGGWQILVENSMFYSIHCGIHNFGNTQSNFISNYVTCLKKEVYPKGILTDKMNNLYNVETHPYGGHTVAIVNDGTFASYSNNITEGYYIAYASLKSNCEYLGCYAEYITLMFAMNVQDYTPIQIQQTAFVTYLLSLHITNNIVEVKTSHGNRPDVDFDFLIHQCNKQKSIDVKGIKESCIGDSNYQYIRSFLTNDGKKRETFRILDFNNNGELCGLSPQDKVGIDPIFDRGEVFTPIRINGKFQGVEMCTGGVGNLMIYHDHDFSVIYFYGVDKNGDTKVGTLNLV